ncbi:GNAT family N-acetyltransferase [Amylibacter kogurei]|uniref:GNAT family N-acetyltransferase n=1 Tax=Paramylibacter kogurei TaxID=1889778 RepID=A0A2G5K571_9RHOB|nr:N-acetyltransferase [Amylibacter kogurei]PIB24182.1 GNAT family N-acetyltransferase [Amylibacter kogurei]
MFQISQETKDDQWEVEFLYDLSFAPGREALSSYRLREDVAPVAQLCLVARDAGNSVAGAIRYWPIFIGDDNAAALLLGPVAVHPTHQGEGLGALLIQKSLEIARDAGWARVILVGDAPYYARFGFQRATNLEFPPPTNPERLLFLELLPDGFENISGKIHKFLK